MAPFSQAERDDALDRDVRVPEQDRGVGLRPWLLWQARYLVALRLRGATVGAADLRGEHPVVLEATDAAAAERVRARAADRGIGSTGGTHADGAWMEFLDPDGIAVRVVHSAAGPREFLGVRFTDDGGSVFYHAPVLAAGT